MRPRPRPRPAQLLPTRRRDTHGPLGHLRATLAAATRRTLATSFCMLAVGALLLPGVVFGAEEPGMDAQGTALAPAQAADETLLVTLPWGSGTGQVGLRSPAEGLTQGPEAIAVAPDGRVAILDSVNRRVVFLDPSGGVVGSGPVALSQARFLAVDSDSVYVLDCDGDDRLVELDWAGRLLASLSVPQLPDVATALFATAEGPCVEVAHQDTYLMTFPRPTGAPDSWFTTNPNGGSAQVSLRLIAGRPLGGSVDRTVKVTFAPGQSPRVRSYESTGTASPAALAADLQLSIGAGRQIEHLVSVDADCHGALVIGARLVDPEALDGEPAYLVLTRLRSTSADAKSPTWTSGAGGAEDELLLAESAFAYVGLPYVVAPDGRVYQPVASGGGYSIHVHSFPASGDDTTVSAESEVQP